MPTMHRISRETLRKHAIDSLPWEGTDDYLTESNKKAKMTTNDGAILRPEERNAIARDVSISCDSRVQPPYKTTGMDNINNDMRTNRDDSFFARVDELKAFKVKNGHLNVTTKLDPSLYDFCYNIRRARRDTLMGKGTDRKLTKDRTAALDAIGFEWEMGAGLCFFDQVGKLKAYKEKHGHLNVSHKEDQSLYRFGYNVRQARKGKKGYYKLDNGRIAALDAIGFNWEARALSTAASQDDRFFARVDKLRAYKEKHGHLNVGYKVDPSLYSFCTNMRNARRAIITGKGTAYKLTEDRITALDAIGFNWYPLELEMSSTSPSTMRKRTQQATNPKINIGDVGYQFLKEFDSGWYHGTVVEILQDADDGWDRRCVYEDGDCEDLSLPELKRLATLSSNVGTIEVVGDVKTIEDGGMKVAASVGESILAAKVNPVIQKAARLKHRPVSKTVTSSTDDLFLTKNSKSPSNNNKAMATDLASLSSVNYDDLTIRELKQVPELTQHIVAIEEVLRNMRRG